MWNTYNKIHTRVYTLTWSNQGSRDRMREKTNHQEIHDGRNPEKYDMKRKDESPKAKVRTALP